MSLPRKSLTTASEKSIWPNTRGTQRMFSVKYLFREANIAQNFPLLEDGFKLLDSESCDQRVASNISGDIGDLLRCTHTEADKRIFVQFLDSVREENKRLLIHTVDTDVLVIAISLFRRLSASKINKIVIKGLFIVKSALIRTQLVYRHSTQILRNK